MARTSAPPPAPRIDQRVADAAGRLLAALARAADRGLDALGLAPVPLVLPPDVRADLDRFFAGTVDLTAVTIRRGHVPGVPHRRAFALPGLVYLGADPGVVPAGPTSGAGTSGADPQRATPTLVHELVHLWQGRYLGPRYAVRALGEQVRLGRRAYDWRAHLGADETAAPALPVEAHAQLVSDAYARRHGFSPAAAFGRRDVEWAAVERVLTGLRAGDASTLRGRTV